MNEAIQEGHKEFSDIVFEQVPGKINDSFILKFPKLIPADLCFDCISLYDHLEDQGLSENSGFNTKEGPRIEIPGDRDKIKKFLFLVGILLD